MTQQVKPSGKALPKILTQAEREDAEDIANGQADVTPDGGKRSPDWTPYLVDRDTYDAENPYRRK